jgi:DNA-binding transcriptional ArsR family regulator
MVQSKTELFEHDLQQRADLFKALSHPARLAILKFLAASESCFTGDITEFLPLSRTTVNQHLTELKRVGLIQGIVGGARTNYCISVNRVNELKEQLDQFISEVCCTPKNRCK